MYLKSLSLIGFKSFADRTRFVCEPGVTVVVGPNGSGKSNIVDAVAWVLGTQATSSLRTEKMEDVIFAGTATRPALGRAEVALTLDNGSGRLPLDLAEVTVTRRLYRDGTSEYEMNGTPCRLLDIQELLGDSGVGRHQHVLIGQGRVDAVLNAGPEEHRTVIEEAAGVIKHRNRRDRSIRRLEATDLDIARLHDLLNEQQRLMKPLRRQARAAEQFDEVRQEWRALRLWHGGEQLRTVRDRLREVEAGLSSIEAELERATKERDQISASLAELQAAAGDTGTALDRDTAAAARLETAAERLQRIALVARERRLGLEHRMVGETERRSDLDAEREQLVGDMAAAHGDERRAIEASERLTITLQALEDEERSLADVDRLPADGIAASLQGDLAALEAAARRDERESADLARRRGAVAAVIEEEITEADRLGAERAALLEDAVAAAEASAAAENVVTVDRTAADAARERHTNAERQMAAATARAEALEAAAAGVIDAESREAVRNHPSITGPVTARLDVPPDLVSAVHAALGQWAAAFVSREPSVDDLVSFLKDRRLGDVGIVRSTTEPAVAARGAGDALVDRLGPSADPALAASLLGDVVIVDSWIAGVTVVSDHPELRAVTVDGDLITAGAVLVAAGPGRSAELIAQARRSVEEAETAGARAASQLSTAVRALEGSEAAAVEAAGAHADLEKRIGALDHTLALLDRSRGERQDELDRLERRVRALAEAAASRTERMAAVRSRLAEVDGGGIDASALEAMSQRREDLARRHEEVKHRHQEATSTAAAAAERRGIMEQRLSELATLFDAHDEVAQPDLERLNRIETDAVRARAAVQSHIAVLRRRQGELREAAGEAGTQLEAARRRRDELADLIATARENSSAGAVERAELRVRLESIAEGLRRDVDADEDAALIASRPEIAEDVDIEAHLAALDAKLRRLGPVNPLAASEYRELEERAGFLEAQLADLEESRNELKKVIEALDEEIGRLFFEAFEEIAAHFGENFGLLFPGGTGKLSLSDPDDPLATGVDIFAQPMGKKVDRLQLLSGGERSLAALAFLFAVFRARPSPFYVLDEVEAALDDANLRRFLRLVETLRDTSQLVIVTHQQQTMEAADVLYGVTMEPGESSRVLAKRMSELVQ